jgi:hypothetical protein
VLAAVLLASCTSEPKTVILGTAPSRAEWRAAATGIAKDIAKVVDERNSASPVSLLPIESSRAPAELHDMLLAELVLDGVPMTVESGSSATLRCRVLPASEPTALLGATPASEDGAGEAVLLCLYAEDNQYIAASRQRLSLPVIQEDAPRGKVLEITG